MNERAGANPGFHEAIGELMSMAALTPNYLSKVIIRMLMIANLSQLGLANGDNSYENQINFLMRQSLVTITTLLFHLVEDLWRWKVFRGDIPKYNYHNLIIITLTVCLKGICGMPSIGS